MSGISIWQIIFFSVPLIIVAIFIFTSYRNKNDQ